MWLVASAVFHYLGPAFAVLLFARVDALDLRYGRSFGGRCDRRKTPGEFDVNVRAFIIWRAPLHPKKQSFRFSHVDDAAGLDHFLPMWAIEAISTRKSGRTRPQTMQKRAGLSPGKYSA